MQKAGEFLGRQAGFLHDRVDARCIGARLGHFDGIGKAGGFPSGDGMARGHDGSRRRGEQPRRLVGPRLLARHRRLRSVDRWNCGLGRKWLEPARVPLMATIPAADHTAAPAMAVPKEAIDSGRNRGRSDCTRTILLNNTNQAGKSRKCPQVGERPQVRDVRIVPFLTSDLRTMQKYG